MINGRIQPSVEEKDITKFVNFKRTRTAKFYTIDLPNYNQCEFRSNGKPNQHRGSYLCSHCNQILERRDS